VRNSGYNLDRHIAKQHDGGKQCLICNISLVTTSAFHKHALKNNCRAANWSSFIFDRTARWSTKDQMMEAFADFWVWYREQPSTTERALTVKKGVINLDNKRTNGQLRSNLYHLVELSHHFFPGLFANGITPAIVGGERVVARVVQFIEKENVTLQGEKKGRVGNSRTSIGEYTSIYKKIIAFICRRLRSGSRLSFECEQCCPSWNIAQMADVPIVRRVDVISVLQCAWIPVHRAMISRGVVLVTSHGI
jgi:hypothetical protein